MNHIIWADVSDDDDYQYEYTQVNGSLIFIQKEGSKQNDEEKDDDSEDLKSDFEKDSENFTVNHDLFAKIPSNYCTKELYFKIDLTEKNLLSRNIFQVTVR